MYGVPEAHCPFHTNPAGATGPASPLSPTGPVAPPSPDGPCGPVAPAGPCGPGGTKLIISCMENDRVGLPCIFPFESYIVPNTVSVTVGVPSG